MNEKLTIAKCLVMGLHVLCITVSEITPIALRGWAASCTRYKRKLVIQDL